MVFGQVGINTTQPTETLHVNGTFRLVDGTQQEGNVLTSDADGVASWQRQALRIVEGDIGAGVNISYSMTSFFRQTGSSITLPPGRFLINVYMLMSPTTGTSPDSSSFWLRTTFSDSAAFFVTLPSADIVGGSFISAGLPGSSIYQPLIGSIIINNNSGADKTYNYVAGFTQTVNTMQTLSLFGGSAWSERSITAFPIN